MTNRKEKRRKGKIQLIDARHFWLPMRKSLGNKRRKIGDQDEGEADQIGEITRIHGNFRDGETRTLRVEGQEKNLIVSKVFGNETFGFRKITVERPLRLNFQASAERVARLEEESVFKNLASSKKKDEKQRLLEIEQGKVRQEEIRQWLEAFEKTIDQQLFKDRSAFLDAVKSHAKQHSFHPSPAELKVILHALAERDETAEACRDRNGNPEPDPELRDTENVPLIEKIEDYFRREVLPHVPDAWIDFSKTKTGYEIPFNRHFYRYEPPRSLEAIEADLKTLEGEIMSLLREMIA